MELSNILSILIFVNINLHHLESKTLRPRLHEQIKHALFAQIRPELLHTDREFEQFKVILFFHVNAA